MIQNYQIDPLHINYLAPSYPIFIQLRHLIQSMTAKKSTKNVKNDINQLVSKVGFEGQKFVLNTILQNIEIKQLKQKPQSSHKIAFLVEFLKQYSQNQSFLSYFPEIIVSISSEADIRCSEYFSLLLMATKLSISNQIIMSLSLYLSDLRQLAQIGEAELQRKLKQLKALGSKILQIPIHVFDELLFQFSQNPLFQTKLQDQFDYLLSIFEGGQKNNSVRMINYLKGDWNSFVNDNPVVQKPPPITIRKADLLRDLGPVITLSIDALRLVLGQLGPINQQQAFDCLLVMSEQRTSVDGNVEKFVSDLLVANRKNIKSQQLKKIYTVDLSKKGQNYSWNIQNFIAYCQQSVANFKWQNIYLQLDRPNLQFESQESFLCLMKYFQKIRRQAGNKFKIPQNIFFKRWSNVSSQAKFLIQVFKCKQTEIIGLSQLSNKRIQKTVKQCITANKQIWGHLDLVQQLIQVSQWAYFQIRQVFDIPMSKYPQLLILTLAQIKPTRGQPMLDEIFSQLFPVYLHNHSNNIRLLQNLWEINQDLVISCICQLYKSQSKKQNSLNLSRVLDIAQVIKESLIPLTNWNDYDFAVPLAILAGKREFLHFEPWITERIKNAGNPFLKATLAYLQDHLLTPINKYIQAGQPFSYQMVLQKAQLSKQLLAFIFESIFLTTSSDKMTKRNVQRLKKIYRQVCSYFPQMSESQLPDQIQLQAERQFIKIYKKQISIDEAIDIMRKLKQSNKGEQKQLFASMITFLYSQLRFHAGYPQQQLNITADLFAGLILNALIQKKLVTVLLQVLVQDLKEDSKKYYFAKLLIQKIKSKLIQQHDFVEKLIQIPYLLQKDPQFLQSLIKNLQPPLNLCIQRQKKIKQAIKIKNTIPQPLPQVVQVQQQIQQKKNQSQDIDILIHLDKTKKIVALMGEKDPRITKLNNICNNLALNTIDQRSKEIQKIIQDNNARLYLAYQIVFKRITIASPNNQGVQIFYRLLERIPRIQAPVKKLSYRVLQAWFSLKQKSQKNDKNINKFKSIGFWLGKLTIGRGTPILIDKINIREILVDSYTHHMCRLPLNISIIIKMLQKIGDFKQNFKLTNPWLGKILGTINEIQQKLKEQHQNTKNQIKGFFINTDIKKNSSIFNTTYLNKNQFPLISKLPDYIKISPDMHTTYKNKGIDLKMLITKAVDDSIQEIVEPVIDRAVKIAIVTAKQLIIKDFALQGSHEKFKTSFGNVVKKLAGPLAQVTCRQPLKASMNRTLKNYLNQHLKDNAQVQNIINKAIPDNLDLGCALIKKAVIQSAEQAIRKDDVINSNITQRMNAKNEGRPFQDKQSLSKIPAIVPEQLRPKASGLSLQQFLIYDEFRKQKNDIPSQNLQIISNKQRFQQIWNQKGSASPKLFRQIIINDHTLKDQLLERVWNGLREAKQDTQNQYYLQVYQMLRQFIEPQQAWALFKQKFDITKKDIGNIVRKLVRQKFFNESCLSQVQQGSEEQQKAISMFQKWLDTARQQIQPFLQSLEEIFNKSQNQIRTFFQHSLNYALMKVQQSISPYHQSINTTYIQDYSKLIIISYKLIASNNSNIFLQHTLQAILSVFNQSFSKQSKSNHQRPFFKLFLNLICDATRKQYDFQDEKKLSFYYILAREFHKINPNHFPNFSFSWLQLISNRYFIPNLLNKYQYWDVYYELISDIFKFTKDNITEQGLNQHVAIQSYYRGIMRLIVLLVHDFQNFVAQFSLQLCLIIPDKFIQIRNIILSAYPKQLKFKPPKNINSKEQLEKQSNLAPYPKYYHLKFDKQKYNHFISLFQAKDKTLKQKLQAETDQTLQIFVLYFTCHEESQLNIANAKELLIDIIFFLEGQLKQKFIKFALNLIRYPNVVTSFFIDLVNKIVSKSDKEKTRSVIINKIYERINVELALPWGILYLANLFQSQKIQQKNI